MRSQHMCIFVSFFVVLMDIENFQCVLNGHCIVVNVAASFCCCSAAGHIDLQTGAPSTRTQPKPFRSWKLKWVECACVFFPSLLMASSCPVCESPKKSNQNGRKTQTHTRCDLKTHTEQDEATTLNTKHIQTPSCANVALNWHNVSTR